MLSRTLGAVVGLAVAGTCLSADMSFAATLNVVNYSFEDQELTGGSIGSVQDWSVTGGGLQGTFKPTNTHFNSVPDGNQTAFANTGSIWQDTGQIIVSDLDYTLTVAVGNRSDVTFAGASIGLYVGDVATPDFIATTTINSTAVTNGSFDDFTVFVLSDFLTAYVGQSIGIILKSNGSTSQQVNFDKVRLYDSAVAPIPLPAALPLVLTALGGLGLFGWRRRQRST